MISELPFGSNADIRIPPGVSIFCDLDGTLVDTDNANLFSYQRAVSEVTGGRLDLPFGEMRVTRGTVKILLPSLTDAELTNVISLKTEFFSEYLAQTLVNTTLARLITERSSTNTLVLVTHCREKRAVEVLRHHKLHHRFSLLICWEQLSGRISSNKYENAISMTGANRESVIVFDNDPSDVEAAMLAGVPACNIYKVIPERATSS